MQLTRNPGLLALSVWLILVGLLPLLNLSFPVSRILLALLAIAAGVLLMVGQVRQTQKPGPLVLAIWLIATGVLALLRISFPASGAILALTGIAAGVLLLLGR